MDNSKIEVIVCVPLVVERKVEKRNCPTCKSDQAFLCEYEEWYGWTDTCLRCGDRWMDGELCPRPLNRRWRKASVQYALDRIGKPVDPRTSDINGDEDD